MESRLIINNFGPIKHVDIVLKNVNVLIGQQASGKSAIAKLYTIFKAPRKFFYVDWEGRPWIRQIDDREALIEVLDEYNFSSFLQDETEIEFDSELHNFSYRNGQFSYIRKLAMRIEKIESLCSNFELNREIVIEEFKNISDKFFQILFLASCVLDSNNAYNFSEDFYNNINESNWSAIVDIIKNIEKELSVNAVVYIPCERIFSNIIKKSALNLFKYNVPIPKHILSFGAELEKVDSKEIDLSFIQSGLMYKSIGGEEKVFTDNMYSISLLEAASGIQSVIPILQFLDKRLYEYHSFVIEEPELNLFPTAQYGLIQLLESNRIESHWEDSGTSHTYTTHSPYILSALNNLLYAYKVKNRLNDNLVSDNNAITTDIINEKVRSIVKSEINPAYFTAYQISDGHAESIFDEESGLIMENYIDVASDKITEDFESLMDLMK